MSDGEPHISARARAQLLAVEVPTAKHTADGIAEFFPAELNVSASGPAAAE